MPRLKARPRIPLAHRLPNAPPHFAGREREVDWLAKALERSPVALVTGPGGIGKTALVLRTIAERFPEQLDRTVFIQVRPGEPADQLRLDLVRTLAKLLRRKVDLASLAGDPEALVEEAIELADAGGLFVVLDDVHHSDVEEMRELLTQLMSYARESRFIATSRMVLATRTLSGQTLSLGAMSEAELSELAKGLSPASRDADLFKAISAASGSPWLLLQYISTGEAGLTLSREQLLAGLAPEVESFLEILSLLRAPFALEKLEAVTKPPAAETLASLERRGLVQHAEGGVRIHDIVSGLLFPPGESSPRRIALQKRVANALVRLDDPDGHVEAARLFVEAGEFDALIELLDRSASVVFAAGMAPRLWVVIGDVRDPRIASHQLRCASEMGNPTALSAVGQPTDPGPEERLAWASTVYAQGDIATAQTLASEIIASHVLGSDGDDDQEVALHAAILRARCLLHEGLPERAAQELARLTPHNRNLTFRRDALLLRCHASARFAGIDPQLAELRRQGETVEEGIDGLLDLAFALHEVGRRESADELLNVLLATPRGGSASLLVARQALLLRARIRLENGQLVEAGSILDAVRPYVRSTSLLRPFVLECDAARRLAVGDLRGLSGSIETAEREATRVDRPATHRIATLRERLAMVEGLAPERYRSSTLIDPSAPILDEEALRLLRRRRIVRLGAEDGQEQHGGQAAHESEPATSMSVSGRVEAALLEADTHITQGRAALAAEAASRAALHAARAGRRVLELEARLVLADAHALSDNAEAYASCLRSLEELGRALSSPRARLSVELHQGAPNPATLERIASYVDIAPTAARRARALLGGHDVLDRVDQRVFDVFRGRDPALAIKTVLGPAPNSPSWHSGWGLDCNAKHVWLPDGRSVALTSKALAWRILEYLVSVGGSATKEELILGVWAESSYHPGRHDPRLQMSMRKVREAIEDDPSSPTRLVTLEDGYGLGGVVRVAKRQVPQ